MKPWLAVPLLALIAALGGITTALAIDTSSALYTSNIQLFNLGITRQNFPAATEISGSALIDAAFMEADTLNAVVHEGPTEIPSMPPNNRIRILDFVLDDGGSFVDFQSEAQNSTPLDFPLLPITPAVDDAAYFACDNPCRIITVNVGQEAAAIVGDFSVLWEYFNGTSFVTASNVVDRTESFTLAGMRTVSFDMPSDFATTTVTGSAVGAAYWVRARVDDASFTLFPQQALGTEAWYENGQWWMWGKTQNINQELLYNLSTGGPDLVTNHQIIPGDAGIVTPDDASIELGDTYTVHFDGSINFTAGVTGSDVCIVCKDAAFRLYISDFDAITLDVTGAGTTSLTLDGIPDSVDLPTSISPHVVDVISDGTDVTLAVDGVGSTTGTAQTVTDNANDWSFGSGGGFVFANTIYFLPDDTATAFELFNTQAQWSTGTLTDTEARSGRYQDDTDPWGQPAYLENYYPATGTDDGQWSLDGLGMETGFNNTAIVARFGYDSASGDDNTNSFFRFPDVNIEQGATIDYAAMFFTVAALDSDATVSVRISAIDEDDASAPTNFAAADGATRTTAFVDWNPVPTFVTTSAGNFNESPDISSVLQEIVDRPGWVSGNSIVLYVENNGSTVAANIRRDVATYEARNASTVLRVRSDSVELPEDFIVEEDQQLISSPNIPGWITNGTVTRRLDILNACHGRNSYVLNQGANGTYDAFVRQTISNVNAGEVWSFSMRYGATNNDADVTRRVRIDWLDSGGSVISTDNTVIAGDSTSCQTYTRDGLTAPANTASLNMILSHVCTAGGASCGSVQSNFDQVLACIAPTAPTFGDACNRLVNPSFEIDYPETGTWISPTLNLTQTNVESSSITWESIEPLGSTLTIETSIDNQATWQPAVNAGEISGITEGDDVSGLTLHVRITMVPSPGEFHRFSPIMSLLAVIITDDVLEDQSILFYELRETPSFEIDDLSPNANNGVMSYPVQLTGIFSAMTPLQSNRVALSQAAAIGAGDFASPVTGSATNLNLFGGDPGSTFPLGGLADTIGDLGYPVEFFWIYMTLIVGIVSAAAVWKFSNGNEMLASIVLGAVVCIPAAMGAGLVAGWVAFIVIILLVVYNILRSRLPI